MRRIVRTIAATATAALLVAGAASPAAAGTPGSWDKIGGDVGSSLWLPTAYRTSDDVLHVAYGKNVGPLDDRYFHVAVSKNGVPGSATTILATGWSDLHEEPKLVGNGSGIRLVFTGLNGGGTGFFYQATSTGGSSWSAFSQISPWDFAYATYGLGADTFGDGTPIVGGALNSDAHWHVGTNAAQADGTFTIAAATLIDTNVAVDRATDEAWLAWYDLDRGGVWARQLTPSLGAATEAPSAEDGGQSLIPGQQVPLVATPGGGVYTAYCTKYPTCTAARVWEVGTNRSVPLNVTDGTDLISLGTGPSGRLWVVTHDNYTGQFYATRSNGAVSKFGPWQKIAPPAKSVDAYGIAVEGTAGRGDIVANVVTSTSTFNIWHTQVLPGLALSANDTKWDGDARTTVTFTVKDAGQNVDGAKVRVGTRSCTTAANGTCKISFPTMGPGKLTATATAGGYAKDTLALTVTA